VLDDKSKLEDAVAGVKTQAGDINGIDVPIDNPGTGTQIVEAAPPPPEIYTVVDQQPVFPGDVRAYLADKLNYPDQAREAGIEGRVVVRFVVDEEGRISQASVQRGIGGGCDEEALRVVRGMPKWTPAKVNGKPVKSYFSLPIKFTLE
jgi:protein TonB